MVGRHDYYTLPRILKQRVSTLAIKQTSLAFILKVGLFCCKKKSGRGPISNNPLSRHLLSEARLKIGPVPRKLANFHGMVNIWRAIVSRS